MQKNIKNSNEKRKDMQKKIKSVLLGSVSNELGMIIPIEAIATVKLGGIKSDIAGFNDGSLKELRFCENFALIIDKSKLEESGLKQISEMENIKYIHIHYNNGQKDDYIVPYVGLDESNENSENTLQKNIELDGTFLAISIGFNLSNKEERKDKNHAKKDKKSKTKFWF